MERNRIRWDVSRATLTVRSAVVGGQARRRVVEAQEEAEEAHCFERQNRKREIDVCVFVSILLATSMVTMAATIVATGMPRIVDSLGGSAYYSCIFFAIGWRNAR
jgi:hypothetical protein